MRLNKVTKGSCLDFEGTAFGELTLSSSGLGENVLTVIACDNGLGMTEDDGSFVAASALDIHEIAVGSWHQSLEFVRLFLLFKGGVKEISVHLW